MEGKELISIIIPVYNVENYLERCIQSVIKQTYSEIEIILVNDGSTDDSGDICDYYMNIDKRINVIHKNNGGLSDARNSGLDFAKGKYITFVDSDDCIRSDYIEYLYKLLRKNSAQISICQYVKFYDSEPIIIREKEKIRVWNKEEAICNLLYQRGVEMSAWGKLYHKNLFNTIRFPKGKLHEDVAVMYRIFDLAEIVVCSSCKKYFYFQRTNSIVNVEFSPNRMDYIFFTRKCIKFISLKYPCMYNAAVSRHFSACFQLLLSASKNRNKPTKEIEELKSEIRKFRKLVLKDRNARIINRVAAFFSYVSIDMVSKLSGVIVKLKK